VAAGLETRPQNRCSSADGPYLFSYTVQTYVMNNAAYPGGTGLYDRCLGDVLAVQSDVAACIAHALASAISTQPQRAMPFIPRARVLPDRPRVEFSSVSGT